MLDGLMRRLIDPPLARLARGAVARGLGADEITLFGLVVGLGAALAVVLELDALALGLLLIGRLCDGLDGAVAGATRRTDRGGLLDITCDFVFYGAFPLAFALRDPDANALAAAVLLFAFYVNGATFLAYAAIAAKRGLSTAARGEKSLYFTAGLAEGTETILAFVLMTLMPEHFAPIAWVFAGAVAVTAVSRMMIAWKTFAD